MLKTQITGAKYLSPQTNQMTNLNIAVPADSKDTEFGTSDILLAKDVTARLNTKANTTDILLKKSAKGGYYIEENDNALGEKAFAVNSECTASGGYSYAEGFFGNAKGDASHAEGVLTSAIGYSSHAQGMRNVIDKCAIHSIGIGTGIGNDYYRNAEYIYLKNSEDGTELSVDPKNGYKYLIGVGGYDGISTDTTTYKSVQEVIADLTSRIEQLETKVKALEDANTPA